MVYLLMVPNNVMWTICCINMLSEWHLEKNKVNQLYKACLIKNISYLFYIGYAFLNEFNFFPFMFNNASKNVNYPAWDYWRTIKFAIKLYYYH